MRKLAIFAGGFLASLAIVIYVFGGIFWFLPILSAGVCVLFFLCKKPFCRKVAVFLLGMSVGSLWCCGYSHVVFQKADALCGSGVEFSATVAEYPTTTRYGCAVTVKLPGNLRAVIYDSSRAEVLSPGDRVTGTADFRRTNIREDLYDIASGITLVGSVHGDMQYEFTENPDLSMKLLRFSQTLRQRLYALFPEDAAGFFSALVTGDRSGISYAERNRLAIAGIYHAVSLSGMHVAILMGMLLVFTRGNRTLTLLFGAPILILFVVMTGGNPATVRAATMQLILMSGLFFRREYDAWTALSTAFLLLMLENPWAVTSWGLQLSFCSTAGILFLMPWFIRLIRRIGIRNKTGNAVVSAVLTSLFVTLSATVFSAPLMCLYFGMNSLIAPLTNLLTLWAVYLCFQLGMVMCLLLLFWGSGAQILAWGLLYLYRWVAVVTDTLSGIPFAAVYAETPLILAWSYLPYLFLVMGLLLKPRKWIPVTATIVTLTAALLLTPRVGDGVTVLDVGQGQSIFIRQDGHTALVDCGAYGDSTGEQVARYLLSYGVTELEALVLTHFDADHCDGVSQLMERISVKHIYVPAETEESELKTQILSADTGVCEISAETELWRNMVVYPVLGGEKENDTGLCVLAGAPECDILITGDLSTEAEARLLSLYDLPRVTALVAGHHGSRTSSGQVLLDTVRPKIVLVSTGENHYGLPSAETLKRLETVGAQVYITRECGNLTMGW